MGADCSVKFRSLLTCFETGIGVVGVSTVESIASLGAVRVSSHRAVESFYGQESPCWAWKIIV